jgi:hypothetical protein
MWTLGIRFIPSKSLACRSVRISRHFVADSMLVWSRVSIGSASFRGWLVLLLVGGFSSLRRRQRIKGLIVRTMHFNNSVSYYHMIILTNLPGGTKGANQLPSAMYYQADF